MNENLTKEQLIEQCNYYKSELEQFRIKYNKVVRQKNKEIILLQVENERLRKELGKDNVEFPRLF